MASQDPPFLDDELGGSIVALGDRMKEMSSVPAATNSIKATLGEAAEKTSRVNSLASAHLTG